MTTLEHPVGAPRNMVDPWDVVVDDHLETLTGRTRENTWYDVRLWTAWCDAHDLNPLQADHADLQTWLAESLAHQVMGLTMAHGFMLQETQNRSWGPDGAEWVRDAATQMLYLSLTAPMTEAPGLNAYRPDTWTGDPRVPYPLVPGPRIHTFQPVFDEETMWSPQLRLDAIVRILAPFCDTDEDPAEVLNALVTVAAQWLAAIDEIELIARTEQWHGTNPVRRDR